MSVEPIIASVTLFCTVIAAAGLGHMILNKDEIAKSNEKVERGDT